jgi:hypothetical protein
MLATYKILCSGGTIILNTGFFLVGLKEDNQIEYGFEWCGDKTVLGRDSLTYNAINRIEKIALEWEEEVKKAK